MSEASIGVEGRTRDQGAGASAQSRADRDAEHRGLANRAVAVSAVGLAVTGAIELAIALLTGSVGLLSDALHNLSDVSTSGVVFFGFWVSRKPATKHYPYGFLRAEDLAGLGVALVIWGSALLAGYESVVKLLTGSGTSHVTIGIAAAAVGIVGNLLVSRYKLGVGRRIHSTALIADAHHSRLDALSSVGALVGLVLVAAGFPIGDPIAGIAVTLLIVEVGYEVTKDVLHHLLDGIEPELIDAADEIASQAPNVAAVIDTRGRWTGRVVRLDLDLRLRDGATLADGIAAGQWIRDRLHAEHEMVGDVRVSLAS